MHGLVVNEHHIVPQLLPQAHDGDNGVVVVLLLRQVPHLLQHVKLCGACGSVVVCSAVGCLVARVVVCDCGFAIVWMCRRVVVYVVLSGCV